MSSRLESINAHPAFCLLRNCLSMPHQLIKLKSSPRYRLYSELTRLTKQGTRHPRSASTNLTIPAGKSQHFPSQKVVFVSPRQCIYHCLSIHPPSVPIGNLSVTFSTTYLNLARHLKLTQSLNIGLLRDTNQLRQTRSQSNDIGHQLSTRLYSVPKATQSHTGD